MHAYYVKGPSNMQPVHPFFLSFDTFIPQVFKNLFKNSTLQNNSLSNIMYGTPNKNSVRRKTKNLLYGRNTESEMSSNKPRNALQ